MLGVRKPSICTYMLCNIRPSIKMLGSIMPTAAIYYSYSRCSQFLKLKVGGGYPDLSGPTTKNPTFLCVPSLSALGCRLLLRRTRNRVLGFIHFAYAAPIVAHGALSCADLSKNRQPKFCSDICWDFWGAKLGP